jgi:hypothetical protein
VKRGGRAEEPFVEVNFGFQAQALLDGMLQVRRGLYVDPALAEPWCCDPQRCRPRLGPNLCCKVERRCPHLSAGKCAVHAEKPLPCSLFPVDLVRVAGDRLVTTIRNLDFYATGWSRFDRDMLRCFAGAEHSPTTIFEAQRPVLGKYFTEAELRLMERTLGRHLPEPRGR